VGWTDGRVDLAALTSDGSSKAVPNGLVARKCLKGENEMKGKMWFALAILVFLVSGCGEKSETSAPPAAVVEQEVVIEEQAPEAVLEEVAEIQAMEEAVVADESAPAEAVEVK
jgi:hypothetical protein